MSLPPPGASARPTDGPGGSHRAPGAVRRRRDPFRWIVEHPGPVDAVIFGAAAILLLLITIPLASADLLVWMVFSIPMVAAGAFLRTRTGWATLAIGVLAVLHLLAGEVIVLGDVMIFYALYSATVHGTVLVRRAALVAAFAGAALLAVVVGVIAVLAGDSPFAGLAITAAMMFLGAIAVLGTWAIGRYQYARGDQLRLARERAEQAEREREQRAALAVAEERARIAREMHDVVAHSLSVIIAQADGGRFVASQDPPRAVGVLETIGATGRSALADMRGLLGVLRAEGEAPAETGLGPQPDLADLPRLLETVREAGLDVHAELDGPLDTLPAALGLSMFRLVQEALTNVMKHAGPGARALVRVRRSAGAIDLEVIDDGHGADAADDGRGHGLAGMRERVALYGGTLRTGPLPAGGFRVLAHVPAPPPGEPMPPGVAAPEPASAVVEQAGAPMPYAPSRLTGTATDPIPSPRSRPR